MNYAIAVLGGMTLLQLVALGLLLRRRNDLDLSRVETRLAHFGEALALLTDTTQAGFTSVAAELEQPDRKAVRTPNRAAVSKRIVGAVRRGRSIQDVAADEAVSESEIRLHLGLADEAVPAPALAAASRQSTARRRSGTLNIGL